MLTLTFSVEFDENAVAEAALAAALDYMGQANRV